MMNGLWNRGGVFPALRCTGVQDLHMADRASLYNPGIAEHRICYIYQDQVGVSIVSDSVQLETSSEHGELIYLPPHASLTLGNRSGRAAQAALLRFQCSDDTALALDPSKLHACRMPQARGWLDEFMQEGRPELYRQLQLQSYLYAMCAGLAYASHSPQQQGQSLERYVEQTLEYMKLHYAELIDIEELARNSGASASRFYYMFKTRTGLSPLKYMTKLRLDAAMELLGHTQVSVLEAAHSIGYTDEYYFSRLFKKQMGLTPTEYAQRARNRVVSLSPVFEGDLAALGVKPVLSLAKGWSRNPEQALRLIEESGPELILATPVAPELQTELYAKLNAIAPTIVMRWKRSTWRERFMETAEYLNLSSVAERWLDYYDMRIASARSHIRSRLGDMPHLVVIASDSQFRVFGIHPNINELFYGDLQVVPPRGMQEPMLHTLTSLEEVAGLGCENIVFIVEETSEDSYCAMLENSWRKLSPRHSHSHCLVVRLARPQAYHAQGREELIEQTVQRLLLKQHHA